MSELKLDVMSATTAALASSRCPRGRSVILNSNQLGDLRDSRFAIKLRMFFEMFEMFQICPKEFSCTFHNAMNDV